MRIVAYCNLARSDVVDVLDKHAAVAGGALVGVRQILNFDSTDASLCWPQVEDGMLDPTTPQGAAFAAG